MYLLNVIVISVIGTSVDWEVSLQVGSAGPSHLLPPGWYIEDPRDSILLGNLPINALDEWDVAKLGKLDPSLIPYKQLGINRALAASLCLKLEFSSSTVL